MWEWFFRNKTKRLEEKTEKGFSSVKRDMEVVGKWIKHLDSRNKQLFDTLSEVRHDLSTVQEELIALKERDGTGTLEEKHQQLLEKMAVGSKQTAVGAVGNAVQTGVQTGNFYEILKGLTTHERLVLFTLMNSEMKLSYEDLALLLGKERSTIRGHINAIKQKKEGFIEEISEKNGKKRVFVPLDVKEKLAKYAKVRIGKSQKVRTIQHREVA